MEFKIPVPWGHIAAKSFGNWNGRPVLALHDWLDNAGSFDGLAAQLAKAIYLVVVDLPGHGLSSHLPIGMAYHKTDTVSTLKRVADHQKWKKFSILGHGVGAGLAACFACTFPNMIQSVIMIDEVKPYSVPAIIEAFAEAIDQQLDFEEKYVQFKSDPFTFTHEEALQNQIERSNGDLTPESAKVLMTRGAVQDSDGNWTFRHDIRLNSVDTLRFSHDQCLNVLEGLKGIPVLLFKTSEGALSDTDTTVKAVLSLYRDICKPFRKIEVEGNHYVILNSPEAIAAALNDHIVSLPIVL